MKIHQLSEFLYLYRDHSKFDLLSKLSQYASIYQLLKMARPVLQFGGATGSSSPRDTRESGDVTRTIQTVPPIPS